MGCIDAFCRIVAVLRGQIGNVSSIPRELRGAYIRMKIFARFPALRLRAKGCRPGNASHAPLSRVVGEPDLIVANLNEAGIARSLALSSETVIELRRYAAAEPFYIRAADKLVSKHCTDPKPEEIRYGIYYDASARCCALTELRHDPVLVDAARRYLKAEPQYIGSTMWWCFKGQRSNWLVDAYSSHWHYDIDDYRSVKFIFYLSDVERRDGAHCYLRRSHLSRPLRILVFARQFSNDEMRAAFPDGTPIVVTGPAGTGFAIDNFGLHRSLPCTGRDRLAIEVCFGISALDQLTDRHPHM